MTRNEFIEECCLALQVDSGLLSEESAPDNVENWDSMGWLSLIAMIDEKLGVGVDTEVLKKVKKLGHLINIFEKQGLIK
jgi:acyl carrier protein